jgi:magnesium transporter
MPANKKNNRHSKKAGMAPGTLMHVGERKLETARITVLDYNENSFQEKQVNTIDECFALKTTSTVSWINVDGLHDISIIEKAGKHFDVHSLVLEDILNTGQRPKFEDMEKNIYVVLKMLRYDDLSQTTLSEQVSMVLGSNYVISFQENIGDVFNPIRDRIRNAKGRVRKMGSDYLVYALLDSIVDSYFSILEKLGEKIEVLEEDIFGEPTEKNLKQIHDLKRELVFLRKSVWPLRELISGLQRAESPFIKETTGIYLRDVYDHTIQVIDTVESFRDTVSGMLDIYLSSISNRMNSVMKVLTIIATIFIPLTFVAGIYGMNFKYMPELEWKWGYFAVWTVMVIMVTCMLVFFRKKKWL